MKKIVAAIFSILFFAPTFAGQIVNVEYIHNAINQKWNVAIPYNKKLTNPRVAANMQYLLTAVDRANKILNNAPISDFGTSNSSLAIQTDIFILIIKTVI